MNWKYGARIKIYDTRKEPDPIRQQGGVKSENCFGLGGEVFSKWHFILIFLSLSHF